MSDGDRPSGRQIRAQRAGKQRRARPIGSRMYGRCKATGKTRYATEQDSWGAALKLSTLVGLAVRTYSCRECGCWHLSRLRPGGKA